MDVINLCELVSLNDERGKCGGLRNHYEETETRADVAESGSVTGNDAGLIKATVLSSAVCADGFEIDNVFNDRGFMAERFVKVKAMAKERDSDLIGFNLILRNVFVIHHLQDVRKSVSFVCPSILFLPSAASG